MGPRRILLKGLQEGKLPWRMAHMKVGDVLFEPGSEKSSGFKDRLKQSLAKPNFQGMAFDIEYFKCYSIEEVSEPLVLCKITRKE